MDRFIGRRCRSINQNKDNTTFGLVFARVPARVRMYVCVCACRKRHLRSWTKLTLHSSTNPFENELKIEMQPHTWSTLFVVCHIFAHFSNELSVDWTNKKETNGVHWVQSNWSAGKMHDNIKIECKNSARTQAESNVFFFGALFQSTDYFRAPDN